MAFRWKANSSPETACWLWGWPTDYNFFLPTDTDLEFVEYEGWSYSSLPDLFVKAATHHKNFTACKEACRGWILCVAWSYWHDLDDCKTLMVKDGVAYIQYTISKYSSDNVTHGYKPQHSGEYYIEDLT